MLQYLPILFKYSYLDWAYWLQHWVPWSHRLEYFENNFTAK